MVGGKLSEESRGQPNWLAATWEKVRERAQSLLLWIAQLSVWRRILVSTLLGSLGGSTFLGLLNIYAAYNYCFWFGVRLPVEGLPFLSLAVSLLSFALFSIISLLATALVTLLLLESPQRCFF